MTSRLTIWTESRHRQRPATVTAAAAVATVAGLLVGCSESNGPAPTPETSAAAPISADPSSPSLPGSSIEVSVPPAADNAVPGKVAFDPCFRVEDSLITAAGFDAGSRERNAAEVTDFPTRTDVGCSFWRYADINGEVALTGALDIMSSTSTLADVTGNDKYQVIDSAPINGRPAAIYRMTEEIMMSSCYAAIEAPDGTLQIAVDKAPSAADTPEPCEQIRQVAEIIAPALDS